MENVENVSTKAKDLKCLFYYTQNNFFQIFLVIESYSDLILTGISQVV